MSSLLRRKKKRQRRKQCLVRDVIVGRLVGGGRKKVRWRSEKWTEDAMRCAAIRSGRLIALAIQNQMRLLGKVSLLGGC